MGKTSGLKSDKLRQRYEAMLSYEKKAYETGFSVLAGIDEAGRGPLAGPVVACACILHPDHPVYGVDDSKKLSRARRDVLYEEILSYCAGYAVGIVDEKSIDRINILQATHEAMRIAVSQLNPRPDCLLIDAVNLSGTSIQVMPIIKGDSLSVSIAAASIIAKVARDRMMEEYDRIYPGYGFAKHKGYGTAEHYAALRLLGPCAIHRMSFLKSLDTHA